MKLKNQDTIELLGGRIDLPHKHVCRLYSQPNLALLPSQMAISMPAPMVPPQSFVPVQALRPGRYWRAGCRWRSGWPRRSASLRTWRGAPAPDCERGRQPLFAGAHQPGDLTPTIGGDRQGTIGTRRTFCFTGDRFATWMDCFGWYGRLHDSELEIPEPCPVMRCPS